MSEQRPRQIPGNVVLTLRQKRHELFKRDGTTLKLEVAISLRESLLGFQKNVTHLDGRVVTIASRPGAVTRPGEVLVLKGEGMPRHNFASEFGDLRVTVSVEFPKKLSAEQADALAAHF
jgi:DnaJ-class molecular chaperone